MPDLVQVLFPDPPLVRSPLRLLRWWEAHRLTYNLVVGGAGLLTLGAVSVIRFLPGPMRHAVVPWPLIVAYGVLANVCYSGGWVAEAAIQRWLKRETYGLGPALFRHGLVFSVGLTIFPAALLSLAWIASYFFR